jgi:hypothetical protein
MVRSINIIKSSWHTNQSRLDKYLPKELNTIDIKSDDVHGVDDGKQPQ